MPTSSQSGLSGHGFYSPYRGAFDRSLYYKLLLQREVAEAERYLSQDEWLGNHLDDYPPRGSWLESGLWNGFVEDAGRRDFSRRAGQAAERIDHTRAC